MTAAGTTDGWVPTACSLATIEQPLRLAEFDNFFRTAVHQANRAAPTYLELVIAPEREASARDLAGRESACCSFFQFTFEPARHGDLIMRIGVPDDYTDVLDALQARVCLFVGIGDQHG